MSVTAALREALNNGISSGCLVDTKFILYSHRDPSGRACRPKPLYSNSHVLKTVPYFNDLLFGNFAESLSKDFKRPIDEEESTEDYGYSSDSDLENDEDEKVGSKHPAQAKAHAFTPPVIPCEDYDERAGEGKVVKIPDTAYVTFQAFLMYLYTGQIEFAPFCTSPAVEMANTGPSVALPSPKSMYRLADKYDVPALKTLALNRISTELGRCDIVEESFSRFAARYNEISNLCIEWLVYTWVEDLTEKTCAGVERKIRCFARGELEHATETISKLWKMLNKVETINAPTSPPLADTQTTNPARWNSVKAALIKSIQTGGFFDRKYWVRHLSTGDILRPIYFSSTIMNDKAELLNKLVKYFINRSALARYLKEEARIESDCEDSPRENKETLTAGEGIEAQARAVLITGSFSAWKSLFFYCCTDEILFAPLKSQGIGSRSKYISEKTVATTPPPCSPKSIYVLAKLLEIDSLRDAALADIKDKVSLDNIVDEIFSWVTATQEEIMEMESELFISHLGNPRFVGIIDRSIGQISDGSSPNSADVLMLGLKKAVELKKKSRQPPTPVHVRCSNTTCAAHNRRYSPGSIPGLSLYCLVCRGRIGAPDYYFECVGCGEARVDNVASCRGCGQIFA